MSPVHEQVQEIFSEDGPVSTRLGFEFRPQQGAMAAAIAEACAEKHHLVVEAPTGVGKSLAYLIPIVLFAIEERKVAVVSTHTKNLQEQIFHHDIPLVKSLIGRDFRAVVLKGRNNYLCTTRLRHAVARARQLFDSEETKELEAVRQWSEVTHDGDLENLGFIPSPGVWESVRSEQDICGPPHCGRDCFYQRLRAKLRSADLLIMNHALFFTLLPLQPPDDSFDIVVLDEAHTVEATAASGIGKRLSRNQVLRGIHRLWNPSTSKGLFARRKRQTRDISRAAEQAVTLFFTSLYDHVSRTAGRNHRGSAPREVRIRFPFIIPNSVDAPLEELEHILLAAEGDEKHDDRALELSSVRRVLEEAREFIRQFLEQSVSSMTYWIEAGGVRGENITLCQAPTEIGGVIGPLLFRSDATVVTTSATLSVDNRLDYFQSRLGATAARTLILDSPFDHGSQMKLVIPRGIPLPESGEYESALPEWIMWSIERSGGKALVLFTSAVLMNAVAAALRESMKEHGYTLLVQGSSAERHALLNRFREDITSVLFGLDSFWMGIDVPGEALEHVIITRLPFIVPTHPLTESRLEEITRRGGNSFLEYTLPEAILKFRQGVGRLLRSRSDTGIVTILDGRITAKSYGRLFVQSLPPCPVEIMIQGGEIEDVHYP